MTTPLTIRKLVKNLTIFVFIVTVSTQLIAQEDRSIDLKNFKIIVEKTDSGIKLQAAEGCAWIDLSFSYNTDKPQAINEYGMTNLNKTSSEKEPNLADFLFTISKTENGIALKGIEGTAWIDLSFSLLENKKQAINQFGMTTLE